jgi:hypothetical protein
MIQSEATAAKSEETDDEHAKLGSVGAWLESTPFPCTGKKSTMSNLMATGRSEMVLNDCRVDYSLYCAC